MNRAATVGKRVAALAAAALLAACAGPRRLPGDDPPTLASLPSRGVKVAPDAGPVASEEQAIAAYAEFLAVAPQAPQRAEALRRLGDLEMDRADRVALDGVPDYGAAVARYRAFLAAWPDDPRNDRVLYQLARAQEQGGALEDALKTLTALVQRHPGTTQAAEAHFRRGEMLFATGDYAGAEAAYATVLHAGPRTTFHRRALYMQGWSQYKQGRLEEGLQSFYGVLDGELGDLPASARDEADLAQIAQLKRADRELVEDTFRIVGISLARLQGSEDIARSMASVVSGTAALREGYAYRVHLQLAELYLRQDRVKDAADTLALFVRRQPLHAQAPLLAARVVEIYDAGGLPTLALQARAAHVERYGADSEFRRADPGGWQRAQPLVQSHLAQLARHYHAEAQRSHRRADVQQGERWYRALLAALPQATPADALRAAEHRFLLAELLFEDHQWPAAAAEYAQVAYGSPRGPRSADAGYAVLLAGVAQEKQAQDPAPFQRAQADAALRFADAFAGDPRAAAVLTRAAEQLWALGEGERARDTARQALAAMPPPDAAQRRTAFTVIAHQAFEQGAHAEAEQAYREVLTLADARWPARAEAAERLATAIYRQAEAARAAGETRAAVAHFERIAALGTGGALAGGSAVRAAAQFDAAAALLSLKDWAAAARTLEAFRQQQPGHALQAEVAPRLALAYLEMGRAAQAATEFERVAAQSADLALARGAAWQAAELHQQAAAQAAPRSPLLAGATRAYESYLQRWPQPLEAAVEARWRLAELARQDGQGARVQARLREVQQADSSGGAARTEATRLRGGLAALALAEPLLDAYRKVALAEPLQRQLKAKKARMEAVLRAYAAAAENAGPAAAEVTTAATFHTAALYQDFGRALIESARPPRLSKAELEQYNVLLEEQAFPFEEKAIALHESNARRAAAGLYDRHVQASLAQLARLKPVRYAKAERGDAALPGEAGALQAALKAGPREPRLLNQLGIAERRAGRFAAAREAYEEAIALDAAAAAPQLNLAILFDLYLGEPARAAALYQSCLELLPADAGTLTRWLAELKTRQPAAAAAAETLARGQETRR